MEIREITLDQALESNNKEYNATSWRSTVRRYASYAECKFYESVEANTYGFYPVYANYLMSDGVRTMQEISYSSCLHNGGFVEYMIVEVMDKKHIVKITEGGRAFPNTTKIRKGLAEMSKIRPNSFFATYFVLWTKK